MAIIRLATEEDISRILELYRQLALTTSQAELLQSPSPDDYLQVFAEIKWYKGCELLVAEERGEVIGTIVLLIVPNLSHSASPWALVENVVVDEGYRRRGVGRQLMDYAIARAIEAGCYRIVLTSDKRRGDAHRFYQSLGFEASSHGFRLYF